VNILKSIHRDREISRRKNGHVVDNRNIFLLEEQQIKKAEKAKRKQERQLHKGEVEEWAKDD
jgi:hypothetical protein